MSLFNIHQIVYVVEIVDESFQKFWGQGDAAVPFLKLVEEFIFIGIRKLFVVYIQSIRRKDQCLY